MSPGLARGRPGDAGREIVYMAENSDGCPPRWASSPQPPLGVPDQYVMIPVYNGVARDDLAQIVNVDEPDGIAILAGDETSPSVRLGPPVDMEGGRSHPDSRGG